ncbi:hypothetical protein niasHS_007112 [Heterodera schachtii]|uniref:Uncharacterized protein n=1 Tax=Heterodera schachtii TaxID=97005 RepID=A0ABD2JL10_HETSC
MFLLHPPPHPLLLPLLFGLCFSSPSSSLCSSSPSSAHSFVCSCSSSLSASSTGHLRLSSSSLPDLLHHLVVHSCHRLTIAAGTFSGKTVLEHIRLLDIALLDIRSDSFRAIRRSPRLFLVQNAHLPAVPSRAFTGLSRLQHFWWRNISIGRVHENAFAKMAFVDYLYFHTANIKAIDSGAFGHIHRLGHLFLRDGVRIGRMGARVFCGTRVDELVVERATVKADDAVFDGMRATKVRISDCWWGATAGGRRGRKGRRRRRTRREEAAQVGEMLIRNCTMHRMPHLGHAMISLFHVEHSTIGRLMRANNPRENAISDNPKVPHLAATTTLKHSSVSTFSQHSLKLRILHSTIRLLSIPSAASPSAFTSSISPPTASSVLFRNSSVRRWVGSPFAVPSFSTIRHFLIEESRLDDFVQPVAIPAALGHQQQQEEGPFSHLSVMDSFRIVRSQMGAAHLSAGTADRVPKPFGGSKFGTLEMAECRLKQAPGAAFLKGVEVRERLIVNGTQWPCGRDHCGTEGLFLAPNSHRNLHWQFTSNRCFDGNYSDTSSSSLTTSSSSLLSFSSLLSNAFSSSPNSAESSNCASSHAASSQFMCRHIGPLEECMCRGAFAAAHASPLRHVLPLPLSSSALLFLIGDCPEHSLVLQSSAFPPSVQSLYIFRVRQLIIRSIPPSLRHLNILHSSVTIANSDAFADANLFQLAVDGSDLVGPMPKGGKLKIGTGRLGQIRLNGVNDRWREVIRELVDQQEEAGGTDQQKKWREKDASAGAMVMPRRRGVQQQRERKQKKEEEERETKKSGQSGRTVPKCEWHMLRIIIMGIIMIMGMLIVC